MYQPYKNHNYVILLVAYEALWLAFILQFNGVLQCQKLDAAGTQQHKALNVSFPLFYVCKITWLFCPSQYHRKKFVSNSTTLCFCSMITYILGHSYTLKTGFKVYVQKQTIYTIHYDHKCPKTIILIQTLSNEDYTEKNPDRRLYMAAMCACTPTVC